MLRRSLPLGREANGASARTRPNTRAHLIRPINKGDGFHRGMLHRPSSQELAIVQGSHIVCTFKDFSRSRNGLGNAKHEEHSTKEETEIMRTHLRPWCRLSEDLSIQRYRWCFLVQEQQQERCFQELCACLGVRR